MIYFLRDIVGVIVTDDNCWCLDGVTAGLNGNVFNEEIVGV